MPPPPQPQRAVPVQVPKSDSTIPRRRGGSDTVARALRSKSGKQEVVSRPGGFNGKEGEEHATAKEAAHSRDANYSGSPLSSHGEDSGAPEIRLPLLAKPSSSVPTNPGKRNPLCGHRHRRELQARPPTQRQQQHALEARSKASRSPATSPRSLHGNSALVRGDNGQSSAGHGRDPSPTHRFGFSQPQLRKQRKTTTSAPRTLRPLKADPLSPMEPSSCFEPSAFSATAFSVSSPQMTPFASALNKSPSPPPPAVVGVLDRPDWQEVAPGAAQPTEAVASAPVDAIPAREALSPSSLPFSSPPLMETLHQVESEELKAVFTLMLKDLEAAAPLPADVQSWMLQWFENYQNSLQNSPDLSAEKATSSPPSCEPAISPPVSCTAPAAAAAAVAIALQHPPTGRPPMHPLTHTAALSPRAPLSWVSGNVNRRVSQTSLTSSSLRSAHPSSFGCLLRAPSPTTSSGAGSPLSPEPTRHISMDTVSIGSETITDSTTGNDGCGFSGLFNPTGESNPFNLGVDLQEQQRNYDAVAYDLFQKMDVFLNRLGDTVVSSLSSSNGTKPASRGTSGAPVRTTGALLTSPPHASVVVAAAEATDVNVEEGEMDCPGAFTAASAISAVGERARTPLRAAAACAQVPPLLPTVSAPVDGEEVPAEGNSASSATPATQRKGLCRRTSGTHQATRDGRVTSAQTATSSSGSACTLNSLSSKAISH